MTPPTTRAPATTIEGAGTGEQVWRPWLGALGLPHLDLDRPPARVVVVAPHPDDEVLGVGGLLALLAAAGTQVDVVAVTDGEASHPGGSVPPHALATLRIAETHAALDALGLRVTPTHLHLPDGGSHALERPVLEALRLDPDTWLLGPWSGDGHPDHEAVGRACESAARHDGARLLAYPVWAWHWATPADQRVPWARAARVDLAAPVQAAKTRAVAQFVTQTQPLGPTPADSPVLPPPVLMRFARPYEIVFA